MVFYQHNRLDLERPAIRLFRLEKGRHSVIACEVFQVFLDDRGCGVPYEALSYTWGPPELTQEIRVNNKKLPVTENLHEALVRLRHPDRDRILWIDAICIDQTNARERSHQVQQMGEIYHKDDQVLFWLGPATDDTDSLLETFGWLEDEAGKHPCNDWHPSDVRWGDICRDVDDRLGQRPNLKDRRSQGLETLLGGWFTRVWILQEVASTHAARICCGGKSVSTQYFGVLPGWLGVAPSPHCQAVIDMMPSVARAHSWWADRRDIFTLLRHFGHSNATEPRDIIYALCGISTDASGPDVLTPDYTIPAQEVTSKVSQFLFLHDLTKVPCLGLVSITDLAMRVEQLNLMAILVHLENKDKKSCMRLVNRVTEASMLKVAGAYARLCGSPILDAVLERHGVVWRKSDGPQSIIFRDGECDTIEFLFGQRAHGIEVTPRLLTNALQRDWNVLRLLANYKPLNHIADVAKHILSGESGARWAHNRSLAILAARLLWGRQKPFAVARRLLRRGETLLWGAVMMGATKLVDKLLNIGEPVDEESNCMTPLMLAAGHGRSDIAIQLLKYGDDHKVRAQGQSAVDHARERGYAEASQAIADYIAKPRWHEDVPRRVQYSPGAGTGFINI